MRTVSAKKDDVDRKWFIVDVDDKVLGRVATRIAHILRGKHKAIFTPHVDTGDFVVVVNASKVKMTGGKWRQKFYHRHSGYPGGITSISAEEMRDKKPEEIIRHAVRGMLPHNPLGRAMLKKLKVYPGKEHPHEAQKPQLLEIDA